MLILKAAALAIVVCVLVLCLKKDQPGFAFLLSLCGAAGLLWFAVQQLRPLLARLQQLDQNTRLREQHRLAQKLYDLPQWTNAKTVALTMSQSFELDTAPLILHARHEGKRVLVPRTLPKRQMEFVQIDEDTEFEETGFGVLEPLAGKVLQPQEIDLIVVPGVAFTADGKRLGFGGGYYDRYLANYLGQTVSLALTTQLADAAEWPVEDHDVMIGQVVNLEQE